MYGDELLKFLNIKNIYFKSFGGITFILRIIDIQIEKITVTGNDVLPECGQLVVENKENITYSFYTTVIKDFSMNNTFTIFMEDPFPQYLQDKIIEYNNIHIGMEKRKEERYIIGLENWTRFRLKTPECTIVTDKNTVKCIISNASVHGVLLTGNRSFAQVGEKIILQCNFISFVLRQKGIIVNIKPLKTNYFAYSVRFIEPLSVEWCKNILQYGDSI